MKKEFSCVQGYTTGVEIGFTIDKHMVSESLVITDQVID